MSTIMEQLEERIGRHVATWQNDLALITAIVQDVRLACEVEATLRERAAFDRGWAREGQYNPTASAYPLPKRSRRVLREEPVPGTTMPLYRVRCAQLEINMGASWVPLMTVHGFDTMRHALDLYDRPHREEEAEVDPENLWA